MITIDNRIVIGCKVKCPFDEEGIVQEIQTHLPWNNVVKIKLTKGSVFNTVNSIVEYFPEKLIFLSNSRKLKNVVIDAGKIDMNGEFLDYDGLVIKKKSSNIIYRGYKHDAQDIIGHFNCIKIKNDCLVIDFLIYDWKDEYSYMTPILAFQIHERDKDIPEKISKFNIYSLTLSPIGGKTGGINTLFEYLNKADKIRIKSKNDYQYI